MAKKKLEETTRIRIDEERINDSESLDVSFLDNKAKKKVTKDSTKKEKILEEKSNHFSNMFSVFGKIISTLFLIGIFVFLLFFLGSVLIHNKNYESREIDIEDCDCPKETEIINDKNYLIVGDFHTIKYDFLEENNYYVVVGEEEYTTDDVVSDLRGNIYQYNPSVIVLELGINDLRSGKSIDDIIGNYELIFKGIKENREYAKVYVESIYPINNKMESFLDNYYDEEITNDDISILNDRLKELASNHSVAYIDVAEELVDDDGLLKEDYTTDGMFLNDEGYEIIVKKLNKIVDE